MTDPTSTPGQLPTSVGASPDVVQKRLGTRLLPVASLWFPTPRELRAWADTGNPLYVRRLSATRFEVGPRLASMWASCFSPVWEGRLDPSSDGTTIRWSRRLPWFTLGLLVVWWLVLVGWPIALYYSDDAERWTVFWAFLVVASTAGPAMGAWFGAEALEQASPWLAKALVEPDVDEDW